MNSKEKLISAVTEYDRKESRKAAYNRNALGIYFTRVDEIMADINAGAEPRDAIIAAFTGRLQDHCLRSLGFSTAAEIEQGRTWHYQPVKLPA